MNTLCAAQKFTSTRYVLSTDSLSWCITFVSTQAQLSPPHTLGFHTHWYGKRLREKRRRGVGEKRGGAYLGGTGLHLPFLQQGEALYPDKRRADRSEGARLNLGESIAGGPWAGCLLAGVGGRRPPRGTAREGGGGRSQHLPCPLPARMHRRHRPPSYPNSIQMRGIYQTRHLLFLRTCWSLLQSNQSRIDRRRRGKRRKKQREKKTFIA